jgi:hypothetical protein
MKRSIIVTDLTRFNNPDIVCTAGVDPANGECLRPMPYFKMASCRNLKILPGSILSGDFRPSPDREGPHREDYRYKNLIVEGPCSSFEFKQSLEHGRFQSVEEGFAIKMADGQKHIPFGHNVGRSIVTIAVDPRNIEIFEDSFKPGKIKLNFIDQSDREYRYVAITDLGFHDYAIQHHARNDLINLNKWIRVQREVFVRLGLSRRYQSDGRDGYWLQANGIYTFPDYHKEIRSYHSP